MREPGQAIADEEADQQPPGIAGDQHQRHADQPQHGAQKMQAPRRTCRMFAEIEGIEFGEAAIFGHGRAPQAVILRSWSLLANAVPAIPSCQPWARFPSLPCMASWCSSWRS